MDKKIEYFIIEQDDGSYELFSIVDTDFGGPAENFVFKGTLEECKRIEKMLDTSS